MRRQGRQGHGIKIGLATMAGLMLLAGCSSVPDAINPVEWYRGAASLFDEEEAPAPERTASERTAGDRTSGDQAYPNLATVPARPTDISSPSERRAMRQGLVADRDQILTVTGVGDVLEPEHGVAAVGSGGNYALAAARALIDEHTELDAEQIARKAMKIAADICVYTNGNLTIESL